MFLEYFLEDGNKVTSIMILNQLYQSDMPLR